MGRALAGVLLLSLSPSGYGGDFSGHAEILSPFYPSQTLVEGRVRLFARYQTELGARWFFLASAYADGVTGSNGRRTAGVLRPHETYLERRSERLELRFGFSNLVWGVLDEILPEDVVNPIDLSRFVLEGRAEARLPVALARLRVFLPSELSLEAVLAPFPRRGTFDQLDEASSPFAPAGLAALPRSELPVIASNMEWGFRLRGTNSGVDWGASVYRDVVDFDRYQFVTSGLTATRPPRWMVGGDLETARGRWVFRGEGAFYLDDPLQAEAPPAVITRWSFQGGLGADRRVGESTVFLNALYRFVPEDPLLTAQDEISLVGGLSRDFSRATANLRLFGLWNARAGSGFARAIWSLELVENLRFEVGGGAFLGEGGEILGLLAESDFVVARLRLYF